MRRSVAEASVDGGVQRLWAWKRGPFQVRYFVFVARRAVLLHLQGLLLVLVFVHMIRVAAVSP